MYSVSVATINIDSFHPARTIDDISLNKPIKDLEVKYFSEVVDLYNLLPGGSYMFVTNLDNAGPSLPPIIFKPDDHTPYRYYIDSYDY